MTWLFILVNRGIMNQIVHNLGFHIRPQGHHELWKARSRTIWFMIPLGNNMVSQVTDYLVHDALGV
jgi:hypothetical protein